MKSASLLGDWIPGQIVGDLCFVTAFIEICPHSATGNRGETGEEHADETIGNGIDCFPTAGNLSCSRLNGRSLRDKSHQFVYIRPKSQKKTTVQVALYIKISQIISHRTEEKFQTAVLTDLV